MSTQLVEVPIELCVSFDEMNSRTRGLGDLTDLVESIKSIGVQQPLLGKRKENDLGEVQIYAGFRRLAAAKKAGLSKVPVKCASRRDVTNKQMFLYNATENIQREDLNPVDEALAFQRLQTDFSMSIEDICASIGVKKNKVQQRFRLLKLEKIVREAVHDCRIPVKAALEIDRLPKDKQPKFVGIAEEMSGNRLKSLVDKEIDKIQKKIDGTGKKEPVAPDTASLTENIRLIRQATSVLSNGLGYDTEAKERLKDVNFRLMELDHLTTVAKLFDDCADKVPDDIDVNDKAMEEIVRMVEGGADREGMVLDNSLPVVRQGVIHLIAERAQEIAQQKSEGTGRRTKVTYAIAQEALAEYFTSCAEVNE